MARNIHHSTKRDVLVLCTLQVIGHGGVYKDFAALPLNGIALRLPRGRVTECASENF